MRTLPPAHRVAWLLVALASLWLRSGVPIHAIADANLDDLLFLRLARNIGSGTWLGPADQFTLAKGAFYPLFILGAFVAGIPLKLAEQAAWLLAAALLARAVARTDRAWLGTALFAVLAFSPTLWTVDLSRVIREGLYASLSLAVVASGMAVAFAPPAATRRGRVGWALARGLLLGLVAGAFWLTREEGVWLLPALAALLLPAALGRTAPLLPTALSVLAAVLAFGTAVGANMALNQRFYGVSDTVEVNSAAFRHAYGALSRIRPAEWRRYVVFPRDARELAYAASPAARELRPAFEGKVGDSWRAATCAAEHTPDCTEIMASWFQWALRDAVAAAGHYASLSDAAAFYARLADEIDAACDRGDIPCLPPRATLLPPFRLQYVPEAIGRAAVLLPELLRLGGDTVHAEPGTGPARSLDAFEDAAGPVLRASVPLLALRGWVGSSAAPAPLLALRPAGNTGNRTDLVLAPPLPGEGEGGAVQGFELSTDCSPDSCDLVVTAGTGPPVAIPLSALQEPTRIEHPAFVLRVEFTSHQVFRRAQATRVATMARLLRPVGRAYAATTPVLAAAGLLGVLAALLLRPREAVRSPVFVLAAASAAAIASRVALIAYLDVTSIRSAGILYLSPATPFVLVLAVAGTVLLARLLARRPLLLPPVPPRKAPRNPGNAPWTKPSSTAAS